MQPPFPGEFTYNSLKDGTRRGGWKSYEREELIVTGKVKGYEGSHRKSVAKNGVEMAENPDNVEFLTRKEHFAEHGFDWRGPTKIQDLLNRASMGIIPYLESMDGTERYYTGVSACGHLCSSPDSNWALVNPVNNLIDIIVFIRPFFTDPPIRPREPRPDVHSRVCSGVSADGSCLP